MVATDKANLAHKVLSHHVLVYCPPRAVNSTKPRPNGLIYMEDVAQFMPAIWVRSQFASCGVVENIGIENWSAFSK